MRLGIDEDRVALAYQFAEGVVRKIVLAWRLKAGRIGGGCGFRSELGLVVHGHARSEDRCGDARSEQGKLRFSIHCGTLH